MNNRNDGSTPRRPRRTEPVLGNLDQLDTDSRRRDAKRKSSDDTSIERVSRRGNAHEPSDDESDAYGSRRAAGDARVDDRSFEDAPRREPPFTASAARARGQHRPRRAWWIALVVVVVLVGAGAWAWSNQAALRGMLPPTQLNSLLARADKAYAAGDLSGGPNSARDLYEAARVLDPDNERAAAGLHNVGTEDLKRAQAALARHDYSAARASLEEARSLLGGGAAVDKVDQALAKAVLHHANIDVLISQARAALANGRIDGSDGAAAMFAKVLAGDPHNAVARHGMDQIGNRLATRIQKQLGNNDRVGAGKTLATLADLVPGYSALPSLRAKVAAANRAVDAQRDQHLAAGAADLRAGKLVGTGSDNAQAQYKAALALDPGNAKAQSGLGQVASALIAKANVAFAGGSASEAKALLGAAAQLAPKSADLAAARSRIAAASAARARSAAPSSAPVASSSAAPAAPVLTPAQSAKVARLVTRAKAAARKGDIMLPPGTSAYDLYSAALAIDGDNAAAQAGLRGLPQLTRGQFQQALHADDLDKAHDMLGTLEQLDPGDPAASAMRHELGSAWLDRADHYIRLGETGAARAALRQAQGLVPDDPRISEIGARLHQNG